MIIITERDSNLLYDEITNSYEYNGDIISNEDVEIAINVPDDVPSKPTLRVHGDIDAISFFCNLDIEISGNLATDEDIVLSEGISVAKSIMVGNDAVINGRLFAVDEIIIKGTLFLKLKKENIPETLLLTNHFVVEKGIRIQ